MQYFKNGFDLTTISSHAFRLNQSYQHAGWKHAFLFPGPPGISGRDGIQGSPGKAGKDGKAGKNGTAGSPGRNGRDGRDGSAGARGILKYKLRLSKY